MRVLSCTALVVWGLANSTSLSAADTDSVRVSAAESDDNGVIIHRITCPWQNAETQIRVLVPNQIRDNERLRVVYVLPVEGGTGTRWGDGLKEIQKLKLHEKYRLICVAPTFSALPWYADHPTDQTVAQETYLLKAVVPAVDEHYPTTGDNVSRLLLGFSKSGWGAVTLLLRHPDVFGKAAAWDAPLMMDVSGRFGSAPIFGTQENFEKYQVSTLLETHSSKLTGEPRLMHIGYDNFRSHHVRFEALLNELNVPHVHQDGPQRKHHWNSGWVADAVHWLAR